MGHVVSALGVSVDPEKVEAVMSWERPKIVFEIRGFLGLAGYDRMVIEDFSQLAASMIRLTRNEVKFEWNDCEAPNPGCPLTTRQPAENLYV